MTTTHATAAPPPLAFAAQSVLHLSISQLEHFTALLCAAFAARTGFIIQQHEHMVQALLQVALDILGLN